MRECIQVSIPNANEHRIAIEKIVVLFVRSVSVKGLVVGSDAPERTLGEKIQSGRETSWKKSF